MDGVFPINAEDFMQDLISNDDVYPVLIPDWPAELQEDIYGEFLVDYDKEEINV